MNDPDRAERGARLGDRAAQRSRVAGIGGKGGRRDPARFQGRDTCRQPRLVSRDQRDRKPLRAKFLRNGGGNAGPKSNNDDSLRHGTPHLDFLLTATGF